MEGGRETNCECECLEQKENEGKKTTFNEFLRAIWNFHKI